MHPDSTSAQRSQVASTEGRPEWRTGSEMQLTGRGFTGVRGGRRGEMLLAEDDDGTVVADIHTACTFDDCPDDFRPAIDADKRAAAGAVPWPSRTGPATG